MSFKDYGKDGRPVGEVKSPKPYEPDSGPESHVQKAEIKGGINPIEEGEV